MDVRRKGRDISLPITLILVGFLALWLRTQEGDWTLWRLMVLLIPVFILSAGLNLAAEHRRMAASVVLSTAGAALLAQGLGLVDWPVWEVVAKAWPLAVVALGVDLALDRTSVPRLALGAVVGGLIVAGAVFLLRPERVEALSAPAYHLAYPTGAADAATVVIRPAVASLRLSAASESASLLEMDFVPNPDARLVETYQSGNERARIELSHPGEVSFFWPGLVGSTPRWTGSLAPGVALDIVVDLGAGSCSLDLRGLDVRSLDVNLGAGECTVHLPNVAGLDAKIDSGVGQITVLLAEGLEARVRLDAGLTAISVGEGLDRDGDDVVTPGYAQTAVRAEMSVSQGVGSVVIRRE